MSNFIHFEIGTELKNSKGHEFVIIGDGDKIDHYKVKWKNTNQVNDYPKNKIYDGTDKIINRLQEAIDKYSAEFKYVENPYPENDLPDLDYGGCTYLGYAGLREGSKAPEYFFKCYCGNTFKCSASRVITYQNPSCGCNPDILIKKVSSSLFERHMETWNPDTEDVLIKKLPVFKGIVGREKIAGYSLVDKDVYDVWSKIMWVFSRRGYVVANYSKDNCRRLGIKTPENRNRLTLFLHRCVLGLGHDTSYKADHINGKVDDNRKENLRSSTTAENNCNRNKVNNKNGVLGVKFNKNKPENHKRWVAVIMSNGKCISKRFRTKAEAVWYRDLMAVDLHEDFASLNHPENLEEYKENLHLLHYK